MGLIQVSRAQRTLDSNVVHANKRLKTGWWGTGIGYGASMSALGTIWYDDLSHFRFFNDMDEWGYMDKLGHLTTAQHIGVAGMAALKWSGVSESKAIWWGGSTGFLFLSSVELFDGFSEGWGFSYGDFLANGIGAGLAISQELLWGEQRVIAKWSYQHSPYAKYRPELLGSSSSERWLKDYNGQIYWLSIGPEQFLKTGILPRWLNLAGGYGIDGYTSSFGQASRNSAGEQIPTFHQSYHYYISPDINLSAIKSKSRFVNTLLGALNFIKIPLPGLTYSSGGGWSAEWLVF